MSGGVRVRPTELGLKGLMLLAALEVAFLATSYSNLFFLLITFCCVLGVAGLVAAIRNVHGVDVRSLSVPLAAAGAARHVEITVAAGAARRRFDLAFALVRGRERLDLGWLPLATGTAHHRLEIAPRSRGVFHATTLLVQTRHPFGLFQATRRVPLDVEVATHPDPGRASAAEGADASRGELAFAGAASPSVAGLREFRGGDSITAVHWKATARRGTPIVKEREPEGDAQADVVLDRRCDEETFENALSLATAFVLAARAGGPTLQLRSQDFAIEVNATGDAATKALRWLAAATPLPRDAAEPPRPRAGAIVLPIPGARPERSGR